jgi:hypothetical protein
VNLFVAPTGYRNAETLVIYPFTGSAIGYGAQTGIGNLVAPVFEGYTNVFFLRMGDSKPADGYGGELCWLGGNGTDETFRNPGLIH